jgi:ketosteroid isomerase-like protein
MMDRAEFEQLLRRLYLARVNGDVAGLCRLFAEDAQFRIAGSSDGKPIAISARGVSEVRAWLTVMVKTFRLSNQSVLSMLVEGEGAAVHWRANIHSRVTGAVVATELVDLIRVRDSCITSYSEFFVPC